MLPHPWFRLAAGVEYTGRTRHGAFDRVGPRRNALRTANAGKATKYPIREGTIMFKKGVKKGTVRFSLKIDSPAKCVELVGDFTHWKPEPMKKGKAGEYAATVTLNSGTYEYKFLVDGNWMTDPDNSAWAVNPYGSMNSVAQVD